MKRRSSRRVFALLLGIALVLGMNLSAVQASDMALAMAMAGASGASGDCEGCGGGESGAPACASMLHCAGMAAVLAVASDVAADRAAAIGISGSGMARDLIPRPDPHPPKPRGLD